MTTLDAPTSTTTLAALTAELGELVADATGLPTSIDPVRPPSIPGCFVGPPRVTPDPDTGGRLLLAQWEIGALVPAVTGAWTQAADHAEHIANAVIAHPTLGLVEVQSRLYAQGDGGEAPGYRIDVAVLLHQGVMGPLVPPIPPIDGAATLGALAGLVAAGDVVPAATIDGAATLAATASLTADGLVVPVTIIDGAATMTAAAGLVVAGTAVPSFSPADLPGLVCWYDCSDLSTITQSAGKVSQLRNKGGAAGTSAHISQGTASLQPATGATVNGLNVITSDGVDDRLVNLGFSGVPANAHASYYHVHAHNDNGDWGATMGGISGSSPYGGSSAAQHRTYQPAGGGSAYDTGPDLPAAPTVGVACMYSGIRDATGYHQRVRHAGANVANDVALYTPTATTINSIEPMSTSNTRHSPMHLCEVIACSTALTGADKTNLENYLMAKWGVT